MSDDKKRSLLDKAINVLVTIEFAFYATVLSGALVVYFVKLVKGTLSAEESRLLPVVLVVILAIGASILSMPIYSYIVKGRQARSDNNTNA